MSELDDLATPQARASGPAILITDASPEGEAISAALRARGFDAEWVPLADLEARVASDAPLVVILDVDEPGAIKAVEKVHGLPEGATATVILIGDPLRSVELDPHLVFEHIFKRPVDLAELAAHVASVVEPARPIHAHSSTPPPSYTPPRPSADQPGVMDSDGPAGSDFPGELDAIDVGSMIPGDVDEDPVASRLSPTRISPELEQLLAAAEQRVTGTSRPSSVPSEDDDGDLMLSPDLLSALDEPIDAEEDGARTGSGVSVATPMQGSAPRADELSSGRPSGSRLRAESGGAAAEPSLPEEILPWAPGPELGAGARGPSERRALPSEPSGPELDPPWSRGAQSGRGVWAQGSPFRSTGSGRAGQTPAESRRDLTEPQRDEPSPGAGLTPKGAPSVEPRSLSGLTAIEPRSLLGGAAGIEHRPLTRRTGADERIAPRAAYEQGPHERAGQASADDERWDSGTRDEGEVRRPKMDQEERGGGAEARGDELDEAFAAYVSGSAASRGASSVPADRLAPSHLGAPMVSAPRDVRVQSLPEAPDDDAFSRRAPAPPPERPEPAFAAPEPRSGRASLISDIPEALPLPPPRSVFAAPPNTRAPLTTAEEPPSSRAAPAITVLGPGDAPRALARAVGSRTSGSLAITTEAGTRRIVLHEGDLVTAASEVSDEALLAFLAARGDISRDVAARLTGKLPPSGRHAGAALIAHGHLGQDDLWPVLRSHAEWIIGHVALIEGGTCEIEEEPPGRLKAEPNVFGGATGAEVFVETIRRVIPPDVALRRLGGMAARLDDGVRRNLTGECALRTEEEELVRVARGRAVVEMIDATEPEIATLLYALVCLEVLDVLIPLSASEAPRPSAEDPLDEEAIRQRVRARLALVQDGDYFAVLGIAREATNYEIRRAYLTLRRAFEPSRLLTAATVDLLDDVRLVVEVLDEAYEILREPHRRERYRRAIEAPPP